MACLPGLHLETDRRLSGRPGRFGKRFHRVPRRPEFFGQPSKVNSDSIPSGPADRTRPRVPSAERRRSAGPVRGRVTGRQHNPCAARSHPALTRSVVRPRLRRAGQPPPAATPSGKPGGVTSGGRGAGYPDRPPAGQLAGSGHETSLSRPVRLRIVVSTTESFVRVARNPTVLGGVPWSCLPGPFPITPSSLRRRDRSQPGGSASLSDPLDLPAPKGRTAGHSMCSAEQRSAHSCLSLVRQTVGAVVGGDTMVTGNATGTLFTDACCSYLCWSEVISSRRESRSSYRSSQSARFHNSK